eukprot:111642-Prorocentrum_minimum.AAC.1
MFIVLPNGTSEIRQGGQREVTSEVSREERVDDGAHHTRAADRPRGSGGGQEGVGPHQASPGALTSRNLSTAFDQAAPVEPMVRVAY